MRRGLSVLICLAVLATMLAFSAVTPNAASAETFPTVGGVSTDLSYSFTEPVSGTVRTRGYRLHLPTGFVQGDGVSRALVLGLHGGGGSASQFEGDSLYSAKADANNFIVAYPEGTGLVRTFNASTGCCGYASNNHVEDVAFMKDLVARLSAFYTINPNKVFATGHSNGGVMSWRLGCDAADVFTAIAPNSADSTTLHENDPNNTNPCQLGGQTVGIINFHGDIDTRMPYDGGAGSGTQNYVREPVEVPNPTIYNGQTDLGQWTALNGCAFSTVSEENTADYEKKVYCGTSGLQIINYKVLGGDHAWYKTAVDGLSSTDLSWAFFALQGASAPTVTINQAAGQEDPSDETTIDFTVVFSEAVTGFGANDVVLTGPAGGTYSAAVSGSGPTYQVAVTVSGSPANGPLTATIAAGAATGPGGASLASTSTDNTVTLVNQVTLFSDGFESGNFSLGGWSPITGNPIVTSAAAFAGSYGARARGTSSATKESFTKSVNTVGYSTITVNYTRRTANLDSGEFLYVEWSTNGTTWTVIEQAGSSATAWATQSIPLAAGAAGQANLRLRFRTVANGTVERGDVDAVAIIGQ